MDATKVAAGILRDTAGRVLITERLGDARFAGLWEFPGGKIAVGEGAATALCRELAEELGIAILEYEHFMRVDHCYADRRVAIEFYLVTKWRSEPRGMDGQDIRWVDPALLTQAELLPADAPALHRLRAGSRDQEILI